MENCYHPIVYYGEQYLITLDTLLNHLTSILYALVKISNNSDDSNPVCLANCKPSIWFAALNPMRYWVSSCRWSVLLYRNLDNVLCPSVNRMDWIVYRMVYNMLTLNNRIMKWKGNYVIYCYATIYIININTCGKLCLSFVCMLKYSNLQTVACHCGLSKLNWHFYYNFNYYCVCIY